MGEEGGRLWRRRVTQQIIAYTDQHSNQQTMEVNGWGDGDDGNWQGWLIARGDKGRDSEDDQTMSADANADTATSNEQST